LLLLDSVLSAAHDWERVETTHKQDFLAHRGSRLSDAQALASRGLAWRFDSALRLASRGTRIDLSLPADKTRVSPAAAVLATAVSQAKWRRGLVGHEAPIISATKKPPKKQSVESS
jgi:hypothetical protein